LLCVEPIGWAIRLGSAFSPIAGLDGHDVAGADGPAQAAQPDRRGDPAEHPYLDSGAGLLDQHVQQRAALVGRVFERRLRGVRPRIEAERRSVLDQGARDAEGVGTAQPHPAAGEAEPPAGEQDELVAVARGILVPADPVQRRRQGPGVFGAVEQRGHPVAGGARGRLLVHADSSLPASVCSSATRSRNLMWLNW
jgi:hypothetical protein